MVAAITPHTNGVNGKPFCVPQSIEEINKCLEPRVKRIKGEVRANKRHYLLMMIHATSLFRHKAEMIINDPRHPYWSTSGLDLPVELQKEVLALMSAEEAKIDAENQRTQKLLLSGIKRQERFYSDTFGIKLSAIPHYADFIRKLLSSAMMAHATGLNYFGLVLGEDILGLGKGMSYEMAMYAAKARIGVEERMPKPLSSYLGYEHLTPISASYGFWARNKLEPDQDLVGISADTINGIHREGDDESVPISRIETETCLEHMLHFTEQIAFCERPMNFSQSTICPPTPLRDRRIVKWSWCGDGMRASITLPGAEISDHSSRRIIRMTPATAVRT